MAFLLIRFVSLLTHFCNNKNNVWAAGEHMAKPMRDSPKGAMRGEGTAAFAAGFSFGVISIRF